MKRSVVGVAVLGMLCVGVQSPVFSQNEQLDVQFVHCATAGSFHHLTWYLNGSYTGSNPGQCAWFLKWITTGGSVTTILSGMKTGSPFNGSHVDGNNGANYYQTVHRGVGGKYKVGAELFRFTGSGGWKSKKADSAEADGTP